jgi:lipid II:glycine glycyltransferase (peptidoglycan interpeptide bridge formation enzyme)
MAEAAPIAIDELQPHDELLQSPLWGRFKERFGWHARPLSWRAAGEGGTLLTLTRATPLGPLVYVPGGPPPPAAAGAGISMLADLAPALTLQGADTSAGRPPRPTAVRFDLPWLVGEEGPPRNATGRLCRAPVDVQPASTVLVELLGDEERLLARMKSKTRYNIRLARRRGVAVAVATAAQALGAPLADWYRLYRSTADRHRITAHSAGYFAALFELAAQVRTPELFLLSAFYRGELVCGIIVSVCGRMARYLYGASAPRYREAMANYALQWAAMQLARARRCRSYDLYGIPPAADPEHPWFGLYRFKTGFGGAIVHRWGCWDYALRPLPYRLLRRAELLRRRYYSQVRPRLLRAAGSARPSPTPGY